MSHPPPPPKKVPPSPPEAKMVGVGIQIGSSLPHPVTGFAKDGPATGCGLITPGDELLAVDQHD
eukprot:CAMPEP_0179477458 /NCGR_PEP_ID=MMETSP0799-20121207/56194_1 /TAXON_ID=46947 /ORGANISM="Geminigera cryophila, Strain CCMP2564" /LENGTH=63 /DNA_ID=CAMNT_0021288101 /DNA_START=68 /DNA_END=256 /DNA_ORIENTATION=+